MRIGYKENYNSPETTKILEVSLLKIFYVHPWFLEPPHDRARLQNQYFKYESVMRKRYLEDKKTPEEIAKEYGVSVETIYPYIAKLEKGEEFDSFTEEDLLRIDALGFNGEINYHSDFLYADYVYTEEYGHEISEESKKVALENEGVLLQTIWDVVIFDCSFEAGKSAEELAGSVPWTLDTYVSGFGEDLFTKVISAKFSSSFFTKCAILSDVVTNHSTDESFGEFIEYNDIGLPLAHRAHIAESIGDLDEEDQDNLEYIDETWGQLCETLGVDKDGDYTSLADMRKS